MCVCSLFITLLSYNRTIMDPWPRAVSIQINMGHAPLSSSTYSFYAHPTANGITSINENIRRSDHIDREITQRVAEMHQIQKEIIDLELAGRRALEAQVRREILLEGELKMRRPEPLKFPSPSSSTLMHHHCYGGYNQGRLLDETIPSRSPYDSVVSNRFSYKRFSEAAVNEVEPPFQRFRNFDGKSSAIASGIAGIPSSASSGRLLVLPKVFHPNLSGTKRKETEAAMADPKTPTFVNKKNKNLQSLHKEWSCTLCQVRATSEQGLRDHLRGKKHKAKEAKKMKGKKRTPRKFKGIRNQTYKQLQSC